MNRLAQRRKQLGLSQSELATLVGVGMQTISNYERKQGDDYLDSMSLGVVKKLSKSLLVDIDYLIEGE